MSFFTRARHRVAAGAGVVALAAGALMAPPFATAKTVDVIVPDSVAVTNANGETELELWQQAGVSFAFDTAGKDVAAGDTFGITFPAGFQVRPGTFQVFESDPATPDVKGPAVADCTTTAATDTVTAVVNGTFNDYVTTHQDITGTVTTFAQMTSTDVEDEVVFFKDGVAVPVNMPGETGVVPPGDAALYEGAKKNGWTEGDAQDRIHWEIIVAGSAVREGAALEVSDTYPSGVLAATELRAERTPNVAGWNNGAWESVSLDVSSSTDAGFTASVPAGQVDPGCVYRIVYVTPVDPAIVADTEAPPTTLVNSATAADVQITAQVGRDTVGSGNATGAPVTTPTTPPSTVTVTSTPPAETTVSTVTETTSVTTSVPTTVPTTVTTTETTEVPTTVTTTLPGTTATVTTEVPTTVVSTIPTTVVTTVPTTVATTITTTTPCPCETSTPTTATTTDTVTVTTTRGTDTGATTGITTTPAAGSLGDIVPGSSGGLLDLGSLDSDSLGGGSTVGAGSLAPLALGSLGLGSAALIGVCMIPIPGLVLPAPLAAFCPAGRQPAPQPVQPPVQQAPGPQVPNGRG